METKRTITLIIIMMVVVLFWQGAMDKWYKQMGWTPVPARHDQIATTAPSDSSTTQPSTSTSGSQLTVAPFHVEPAAELALVDLGSVSKDSSYHLAVRLDSVGAGIDEIVLNEFKKSVDGAEPYAFQHPYDEFKNVSRPLATRSVQIDGTSVDVTASVWKRDASDASSASFSLDLLGADGAPTVRLTKSYQLFPASDAPNGGGYEVQITQSITNLAKKSAKVGLTFNGPTTPPRELDRGSDRMMIGGYLNDAGVYVMQNYVEAFNAKQPTYDFTKAKKDDYPLLWVGAASVYFDALLLPLPTDPKSHLPGYIQKVEAAALNPDAEDAKTHLVVMTVQTTAISVDPGATQSFTTRAFFGPKQRKLLRDDFYSQLPRQYNSTLVITSGFCGFCTFGWLIDTLVWLLNKFHWLFGGFAGHGDWGLSIIALVFLVRFILHPITRKSQQNMARMTKFGPEMERLKQKYKDEPEELNKAMVGFYKEHGATPILGCLPMFLQMPIWVALWSALQSTFELRHAGFLRFGGLHLTWIKDLSQPDHLISLAHPITLWILPVSGLNILPILMGIVFFVQQKYFTPKPPSATPEQEQQQKMMQWMSCLLFPLMLYAGPSGLNLYIFASTTFGIVESKIIRDHIKEREEAEKSGKVIVDAGKKFGGKGGALLPEKEKPKGKLATWIANLQAKAAEMQRDAQRPGNRPKQ